MDRRGFLKGTSAASLITLLLDNQEVKSDNLKPSHEEKSPIPFVGVTLNEWEEFGDSVSGKKTKRIAWKRDYNQMPTYHLNQGFRANSEFLPVATWNVDEESALMAFNVFTGIGLCLDSTQKGEIGFEGNNVAAHQKGDGIMAVRGTGLFFYDWEGKTKRVLSEEGQGFHLGHPVASADGKGIIVPKSTLFNPERDEALKALGVDYLYFPLNGGKPKILYRDLECRNNHTVPNPRYKSLYLIDRDQPPKFAKGGDGGKISRCWIWNSVGNRLIEIRPKDPNRFQIHSNWSHCGKYVYYHGLSGTGRQTGAVTGRNHYIGVADLDGQIIWEKTFPYFYYGHVGSHTQKHAIVLDGLLTEKMLIALFWKETDTNGNPRLEVLGYHNSDWHKGQMSHPHPQMSPNGRYLAFNSGFDGNRSSVNILNLQ